MLNSQTCSLWPEMWSCQFRSNMMGVDCLGFVFWIWLSSSIITFYLIYLYTYISTSHKQFKLPKISFKSNKYFKLIFCTPPQIIRRTTFFIYIWLWKFQFLKLLVRILVLSILKFKLLDFNPSLPLSALFVCVKTWIQSQKHNQEEQFDLTNTTNKGKNKESRQLGRAV